MSNYITIQKQLRTKILNLSRQANSGHIGGALSCIDLLIAILIFNKKEGEEFILSKGHAALALYVSLNYLGEIPDDDLNSFYKNGTQLPAHPAPSSYNGIPFALGSLGHGFSIATGIAHANKLLLADKQTFVLLSDGDTNEGTTWEAAHFAVSNNLENLVVVIDKNSLQGFGNTSDILGDTANSKTWNSIGFDVFEIDGHNIELIRNTISKCRLMLNGKPKVIIANTIKGKGVSFMEKLMEWHYLPMTEEQYENALNEINQLYNA